MRIVESMLVSGDEMRAVEFICHCVEKTLSSLHPMTLEVGLECYFGVGDGG